MTSDTYRAALHALPESFLSALQAAGAWLELDGVKAPRGALTQELRDGIRQYRGELRTLAQWRARLMAADRRRAEAYRTENSRVAGRKRIETLGHERRTGQ